MIDLKNIYKDIISEIESMNPDDFIKELRSVGIDAEHKWQQQDSDFSMNVAKISAEFSQSGMPCIETKHGYECNIMVRSFSSPVPHTVESTPRQSDSLAA